MKKWSVFLILIFLQLNLTAQISISGNLNAKCLIENKGQWDETVLFKSNSQGQNFWLQQHGFLFDLRSFSSHHSTHQKETNYTQSAVAFYFKNSLNVSRLKKEVKTDYYYNYFIGNDTSKWAREVYSYEKVRMENFYQGIDLEITDNNNGLKYTFLCYPNSNPNQIVHEIKNGERIQIEKNGDLKINSKAGIIIERAPKCYQLVDNDTVYIPSKYSIKNRDVHFEFPEGYDKNHTLIIDPVLVFATYSGSLSDNFGMTATYGYDGSAYSGGTVFGNGYPTPDGSAFDISSNFSVVEGGNGITDVVISKYAPDGKKMLWANFIGGGNSSEGAETVHSLICDKQDNIYFFGVTSSTNFPLKNPIQSTNKGGKPLSFVSNGTNFGTFGTDMYVSKLSFDGKSLIGSTYIGGTENDGVNYLISKGNYANLSDYDSLTLNYGDQFRGEIMLDSVNNCIIASCTRSTDFPVKNAFQNNLAGQQDGIVFQLNTNLNALNWSSFYGGTENDACYSVKIDSSNSILIAGGTSSSNLPKTAGAWQNSYNGGKTDGFVAKLTKNGTGLIRSSYIGTTNYDQAFFVEINRNDEVYIYGQSENGQFPTFNATSDPGSSLFICKLNKDLSAVTNSFVFGNNTGKIEVSPTAFLVDVCGNIYVSGWGSTFNDAPLANMPVTTGALQSLPGNGHDFYLSVFKRDFSGRLYATYYGGTTAFEHVDGGTSRFDAQGVVYQSVCGGCGGVSDGLATPGAWSEINRASNCNNLVFKIDFQLIPKAKFTASDQEFCGAQNVTFTNQSTSVWRYKWDFGNGDTTSTEYNPVRFFGTVGTFPVVLTVQDSVCLLTDTFKITINIGPTLIVTTNKDSSFCGPVTNYKLFAASNKTATKYQWSSKSDFSDTLNSNLSDSTFFVDILRDTVFYLKSSNIGCSSDKKIEFKVTQPPIAQLSSSDTVSCGPITVNFFNNSTNFSSFVWRFHDGTKDSVNPSPTRTYNTVGTYVVVLEVKESICGLKSLDTLIIEILPFSKADAGNDTVLCSPQNLQLVGNSFGTSTTYEWSKSNLFNPILNPTTDSTLTQFITEKTTFYFRTKNSSCFGVDSVTIYLLSTAFELKGPKGSCKNDTVPIQLNVDLPDNFYSVKWSPKSSVIPSDTSKKIQYYASESDYLVVSILTKSCSATDSLFIEQSKISDTTKIKASASPYKVPIGGKATLFAEPKGFEYEWTPKTGLEQPNSSETEVTINNPSFYKVRLKDKYCDKSDSIFIDIFEFNCAEPFVFIPNAFSPNGDKENDALFVRSVVLKEFLLRIFNRWGELVFESTQLHIGWDGTFKGKDLPPDVYDYYLEATCIDDQKYFKKGNITLIK